MEKIGDCSLESSADGQWLRVIINNKMKVAFHRDYVSRILNIPASEKPIDKLLAPAEMDALRATGKVSMGALWPGITEA